MMVFGREGTFAVAINLSRVGIPEVVHIAEEQHEERIAAGLQRTRTLPKDNIVQSMRNCASFRSAFCNVENSPNKMAC